MKRGKWKEGTVDFPWAGGTRHSQPTSIWATDSYPWSSVPLW